MKISLVRVTSNFYPQVGGSVKHVIELSKAIDPYLKRQLIIAPKYNTANPKKFDDTFPIQIKRVKSSFFESSHIQKIPGNSLINHLFYYAMNVSKLIKNLTRNGYEIDIVQVHFNTLGLFLSFWFKIYKIHIPIVIMHHGSSVNIEYESQFSKIIQKILIFMYGLFKPDYYIQLDDGTINRHFLNELTKWQIPYCTVYHAIDTQLYRPHPRDKPNNDFILLSNHRLEPFKRVDLSIIAFKIFLEKVEYPDNIKLRVIGSGSLQKDLEELVKNNQLSSYVDFMGEQNFENYNKELATADIIIGTSLVSNVNRSIQEAMAFEKPVIVFDSISNNDLFVNMDNCILVPPGDLEKFSKNIEVLYKNPVLRTILGKNARKTIIDRRSWKSRIEQELLIYNDILSMHPK